MTFVPSTSVNQSLTVLPSMTMLPEVGKKYLFRWIHPAMTTMPKALLVMMQVPGMMKTILMTTIQLLYQNKHG